MFSRENFLGVLFIVIALVRLVTLKTFVKLSWCLLQCILSRCNTCQYLEIDGVNSCYALKGLDSFWSRARRIHGELFVG